MLRNLKTLYNKIKTAANKEDVSIATKRLREFVEFAQPLSSVDSESEELLVTCLVVLYNYFVSSSLTGPQKVYVAQLFARTKKLFGLLVVSKTVERFSLDLYLNSKMLVMKWDPNHTPTFTALSLRPDLASELARRSVKVESLIKLHYRNTFDKPDKNTLVERIGATHCSTVVAEKELRFLQSVGGTRFVAQQFWLLRFLLDHRTEASLLRETFFFLTLARGKLSAKQRNALGGLVATFPFLQTCFGSDSVSDKNSHSHFEEYRRAKCEIERTTNGATKHKLLAGLATTVVCGFRSALVEQSHYYAKFFLKRQNKFWDCERNAAILQRELTDKCTTVSDRKSKEVLLYSLVEFYHAKVVDIKEVKKLLSCAPSETPEDVFLFNCLEAGLHFDKLVKRFSGEKHLEKYKQLESLVNEPATPFVCLTIKGDEVQLARAELCVSCGRLHFDVFSGKPVNNWERLRNIVCSTKALYKELRANVATNNLAYKQGFDFARWKKERTALEKAGKTCSQKLVKELRSWFAYFFPLYSVLHSVSWQKQKKVRKALAACSLKETNELLKATKRRVGNKVYLLLGKKMVNLPVEFLLKNTGVCVHRLPALSFVSVATTHAAESWFYLLDPSNQLPVARKRIHEQLVQQTDWEGVVGSHTAAQKYVCLLAEGVPFVYVGHHVFMEDFLNGVVLLAAGQVCSPFFALACSSAEAKGEGCFVPEAKCFEYLAKGLPRFVGTLWPVTDKEVEKLVHSLLARTKRAETGLTVDFQNLSKNCRFPFLTAASIVQYSI